MRHIILLILIISLSACSFGAAPVGAPVERAPFSPTATSPVVTPSPRTTTASNPAAGSRPTPIPLTEAGFLVMQANGLAIAQHIAYVTSWEGLHLLDISDPAAPYQLGFYPTPNQSAAGVAVAGDRAYIMAIGLHIVDVSNPPRRAGWVFTSRLRPQSQPRRWQKIRFTWLPGRLVSSSWMSLTRPRPAK